MKNLAEHLRRIAGILVVGLAIAWICPAYASPEGDTAAARVTQESYRHLLDDMLYAHDGDNRGNGIAHNLARENIFAEMVSYGLSVELEPFECPQPCGVLTYYNVVGTKLGTTYPQQEYIIGAHFDSVNNPGADDNASGVALVLEAARVLTEYESDYTIRFIAFDREEQGMWGSYSYVEDHIADDVLGMISADMVAYNTGRNSVDLYGDYQSNPLKSGVAEAVATYGDGLGYEIKGPCNCSDHEPFSWRGVPACLLIEDWGNPNYHEPEDSVDTPNYIDYAYATQITRVVVGFLVDQAGVYVPLDCNGNEIEDAEDVATGYSLDCNVNEIPDECEPDCDNSGVPDTCEIVRTYHSTSPALRPFYSGAPETTYLFPSLLPAGGDVTLSFSASTDLEDSDKYVHVTLNHALISAVPLFEFGASQCADPPDTDEIVLSAEWFNKHVGGGVATIRMYASSNVSRACGSDSYITVALTYESVGIPDCNGNFVPDFCDTPGDADGDGQLGLSDYARTVDCMSGPCTDPPCAPPIYADLCCAIVDVDFDGDHDLQDFSIFQLEINAP